MPQEILPNPLWAKRVNSRLKTCFQSTFLQEKKFSQTAGLYGLSPKSSQWEVFGSTSKTDYSLHLHKYVQMRTDVRQHRNSFTASIAFCFIVKCHRGVAPVPPRAFFKKLDQKLLFLCFAAACYFASEPIGSHGSSMIGSDS